MTASAAAPRANGEPAVVDGELRHLSVSQLKDFALCERSWWFSRVMRLARKTTKGQATGTEGHAQLEHYLKTGEDVLGPVAAAGKHLLPEPGEGLLVELPLDAPALTAAGVPFKGFIDLLNLRHSYDGLVRITDHKFTSDIDKWAAKPDDLATTRHEHGIQMIGYARYVSTRWQWAERLELEHIYFQTKGAKRAESRVVSVPAGDFRDEWKRVENLATQMKDVARARALDDVHPNWRACDKYGGCSYRLQCLSHEAKKGQTVSLLSRIQKPATPPAPLPSCPRMRPPLTRSRRASPPPRYSRRSRRPCLRHRSLSRGRSRPRRPPSRSSHAASARPGRRRRGEAGPGVGASAPLRGLPPQRSAREPGLVPVRDEGEARGRVRRLRHSLRAQRQPPRVQQVARHPRRQHPRRAAGPGHLRSGGRSRLGFVASADRDARAAVRARRLRAGHPMNGPLYLTKGDAEREREEALAEVARLQEKAQQLRETLRRLGHHEPGCAVHWTRVDGCSCGLERALL